MGGTSSEAQQNVKIINHIQEPGHTGVIISHYLRCKRNYAMVSLLALLMVHAEGRITVFFHDSSIEGSTVENVPDSPAA